MSRQRVERGGWSLSALAEGPEGAAPVLMSNSLGAGLGMWDAQADWLARNRRVIRYDTRGHGASDAPEGPYSFDDLVDDALAVMDHFGVARADYVGLSLGGMTGLGLGLRAPERVGRLVVTAARADAPEPFLKSWDDRVAAVQAGGMEAIWPGTLDRWLTPDFAASHPEAVEKLRVDFVATAVAGYEGCARALQGLDYLRHLGGMTLPVLYISGEKDAGAPAAAMEAMAAATPGAGYLCIADAAHIVNVNKRDAFDTALGRFLGGTA